MKIRKLPFLFILKNLLYFLAISTITFLVFGRLLTDSKKYSVGEAVWFETYPAAKIQSETLKSKRLVLWDNTLSSGGSAIGNPLYPQTYPPTYLVNMFFDDQLYATRVSYFFHLLLGAYLFFILTRVMYVNPVIGIVGSIFYLYHTMSVATVQNGFRSDLIMFTWWPLVFLLLMRALIQKSYLLAVFAGLSFSMFIHGGAVYNTVFAAVSLTIFSLSFATLSFAQTSGENKLRDALQSVKVLLLFTVLALMFSAPKLLPSSEFVRQSIRDNYTLQQAEADVTPRYYETILRNLGTEYIPGMKASKTATILFKGFNIALFGFAIISLLNKKRRKIVLPLLMVVTISLFASFGSSFPIDFYAVFYSVVPFFKSMHYANRFLVSIYLTLPLLSLFGMELVVNLGKEIKGIKSFLYYFLCLTIVTISLTVIIKEARGVVGNIQFGEYESSETASFLSGIFTEQKDTGRIANNISSLGLGFYLYDSVKQNNFDILSPIYGQIRPYFYDAYYFEKYGLNETFKMWKILNAKYLVLWDEQKNKYLERDDVRQVSGLTESDLSGERKVAILEIPDTRSRVSFIPRGILYLKDKSGDDVYGAKSTRPIVYDQVFHLGSTTLFNQPLWNFENYDIETLSIFDAIIVRDIKLSKGFEDLLESYKNKGGQVVEKISEISDEPGPDVSAEIINLNEIPGKLSLTLKTSSKGFLVYSNTYDPNWRSYLNGKEVPTYMADSYVKGVVIPSAGEHQVVMQYFPKSFYTGSGLALVGFVVLLLLLVRQKSIHKIVVPVVVRSGKNKK